MKQLTTKSQMIERITELSEQVENLNRQLNIAVKENTLLIQNCFIFQKYLGAALLQYDKKYLNRLKELANMSPGEWYRYIHRE